jgi:hypothetical protein
MSGAAAVRAVSPVTPATRSGEVASHVFGGVGGVCDEQVARLTRVIDPRFLTDCGWDPAGQVLAPPSDHRSWEGPTLPARHRWLGRARQTARCRAARDQPDRTGCVGRTGGASCCGGCRCPSSPPIRHAAR